MSRTPKTVYFTFEGVKYRADVLAGDRHLRVLLPNGKLLYPRGGWKDDAPQGLVEVPVLVAEPVLLPVQDILQEEEKKEEDEGVVEGEEVVHATISL